MSSKKKFAQQLKDAKRVNVGIFDQEFEPVCVDGELNKSKCRISAARQRAGISGKKSHRIQQDEIYFFDITEQGFVASKNGIRREIRLGAGIQEMISSALKDWAEERACSRRRAERREEAEILRHEIEVLRLKTQLAREAKELEEAEKATKSI